MNKTTYQSLSLESHRELRVCEDASRTIGPQVILLINPPSVIVIEGVFRQRLTRRPVSHSREVADEHTNKKKLLSLFPLDPDVTFGRASLDNMSVCVCVCVSKGE